MSKKYDVRCEVCGKKIEGNTITFNEEISPLILFIESKNKKELSMGHGQIHSSDECHALQVTRVEKAKKAIEEGKSTTYFDVPEEK